MTWGVKRMRWGWVCAGLALASCAEVEEQRPRARLGALPFPGPFTLYVSSDASELGAHNYASSLGEGARGIVYTCRAGFLDLAHLRESVDWTWFLHGQVLRLLKEGGGTLSFENDDTRFELEVRPGNAFGRFPALERSAAMDEAALRLGQRGAYLVETWHEIESWYGLRTVFFVPEDRSAFTWDDEMSHAVGMEIGARVVHAGARNYDGLAAAEIRRMLEELGIVPKEWVDKAAHQCAGRWWQGSEPLKRDLDLGLGGGKKVPWLVHGLECCGQTEPAVMTIPSLRSIRGRDLSGIYQLRIHPGPALRAQMYKGETPPEVVDAEIEFPRLVEKMRSAMKAKWGDDVDHP